MTSKEERQAEAQRAGSNLRDMAEAIGMTPEDFFDAVKRQVTAKDVTGADFVALLHTAKQYGLDPLRKEVSLIQTKQGPRVYVTFDGWLRVLVSHPLYYNHGWKDEVWSGGQRGKGTLDAVTFWIEKWVPDRSTREVFEHTELLVECRERGDFTPWNKWPSRMLKEKCAMQGTRFCFAMYVPDLDDVRQAEVLETGKAEAAIAAEPTPIAPAAAIPGAKKSRGKTSDAAAPALPAPAPQESIDFSKPRMPEPARPDFFTGKVTSVEFDPGATSVPPPPVVPETPSVSAPATLPAFDPKESLAVDAELAKSAETTDGGMFDDIL